MKANEVKTTLSSSMGSINVFIEEGACWAVLLRERTGDSRLVISVRSVRFAIIR
jgi:hypothetical protein